MVEHYASLNLPDPEEDAAFEAMMAVTDAIPSQEELAAYFEQFADLMDHYRSVAIEQHVDHLRAMSLVSRLFSYEKSAAFAGIEANLPSIIAAAMYANLVATRYFENTGFMSLTFGSERRFFGQMYKLIQRVAQPVLNGVHDASAGDRFERCFLAHLNDGSAPRFVSITAGHIKQEARVEWRASMTGAQRQYDDGEIELEDFEEMRDALLDSHP